MSTTEDKLDGPDVDAPAAERPDRTGAADRIGTQDGVRRLPLAAYVPMGVTSRYAAPTATVDPDRSKGWIKRATPIVMAHKVALFSALIFSFLGLIIQVWIPKILQNGITNALINRTQPLHNYVELIAVLALSTGVFGYISRTNLFKVAYAIEFDLRNILYEHFTRMSFPFYDRVQSGQLISRANSDIRSVQMYLTFAPDDPGAVLHRAGRLRLHALHQRAAGLRGHGGDAASSTSSASRCGSRSSRCRGSSRPDWPRWPRWWTRT